MSPSTNTRSVPTTSTETTTLATSNQYYVTQPYFANTITDIFAKIYDNICRLDHKFMEYVINITVAII